MADQPEAPRPNYTKALLAATALLTGLGLLVIYTSSSIPAYQKYGDAFYFFRKQAFVAGFGFFMMLVVTRLPMRWIERLTLPVMLLTMTLLTLTLIPSMQHKANGAARWVQFGSLTFQPAELAKLALIMFLAKNLSRRTCQIRRFMSGILPNLLAFACLGALIMLQPDFGSTFLLFLITFLMMFTAGLPRRFIVGGLTAAVAGVVLAVWQAPYRMARLLSFLDPWDDFRRGGFQIIQSYLGFQNGGLLGLGLGESRQKLYFLPEAHTDFILSVIGEELGLLGVLLVAASFAYITWLGLKITDMQTVTYRKFLGFGLTSLIALQASINMGVTMGVLPTKGIPLPFVSSGSSSLVVFMAVVALLVRLGKPDMDVNHEQKT